MDKMDLLVKAGRLRQELGQDERSPVDIETLMLGIEGLTVVYQPFSEHISGVCFRRDSANVIAVNSTMSRGRVRFSFAHELYHLKFDEDKGVILCPMEIGAGRSDTERCADQFASYFLMPPVSLADMAAREKEKASNNGRLTLESIVKIEQYFGVSRRALLVRLKDDGCIDDAEAEALKHDVIYSARRLGYGDSLYKPVPADKQTAAYGHYIKQAGELLKRGLISSGRYEELLLEAYRDDLVFADPAQGGEQVD